MPAIVVVLFVVLSRRSARTPSRRWVGAIGLLASILLASSANAADGATGGSPIDRGSIPAGLLRLVDEFAVTASDSLLEESVRVTWPGAGTYAVYFEILRDGALLTVAASNDSLFEDTSARPAFQHQYCVKMLDVATQAELAQGCDAGSRIVNRPFVVTASDGTDEHLVRILWSDRSNVEAGYHIYRSPAGAGLYDLVGTADANRESFQDSSAVAAVPYDYCVAAFDADGYESRRVCDPGMRGSVQAPGVVSATDGQYTDRVIVTWADLSEQETGYRVYRDGALIATTPPDSTRFEDFAALGTVHAYCVATLIRVAGDPDSIDVESIRVCDDGVGGNDKLAPPGSVSATTDVYDDRVVITWADEAGTQDGFEILRDGAGVSEPGAGVTSFEDTDAQPGITHQYCVIARSSHGGRSVPVCVAGRRAIVIAPTDVAASDGDFEDRVVLTWKNTSTTAVLFRISRDGTPIQTISATQLEIADEQVDSGNEHSYCVQAMSAMGDLSPAACDDGHRLIPAPTAVAASDDAFEDRIEITWNDDAEHETGYRIARRRGNQAFAPLDTIPANRTAYVDTTAATGISYDYRVRAIDAYGSSEFGEDSGSRTMKAPESVEATDGEHERKIVVTWTDRSAVEDGYRVTRDDGVAIELSPNSTSYTDEAIAFGAAYTYTVTAFDNNNGTAEASDDGSTAILPPGTVSASDTYDDQVIVTWIDASEINDRYRIFRNGSHLTNVGDVRVYIDDNVSPGVTYDYCVRASIEGYGDSEEGCDTGIAPVDVPPAATPAFALQSRLEASDGVVGDRFGFSVAIDGDLAVVGAHAWDDRVGSVYCFRRDPDSNLWEQFQSPRGNEVSQYGEAVAISGNYMAIGGSIVDPDGVTNAGGVWIYKYDGTSWSYISFIAGGGEGYRFGSSVALDGDLLVVGAPGGNDGHAKVYRRQGDDFDLVATLDDASASPGARQGHSVAVDGDRIVVGAPGEVVSDEARGAIYVYERTGTNEWTRTLKTTGMVDLEIDSADGDDYGHDVALRGDQLIVGAPMHDAGLSNAGACYVWDLTGDSDRQKKIVASDRAAEDLFGWNVAMEGSLAFVTGGSDARQMPVYVYQAGSAFDWQESLRLTGDESIFGGLAVSDSRLFIGTDGWVNGEGHAYAYDINPAPSQVEASDGAYTDRIQLRWNDASPYEDGFRVYRDGVLIETLGPGTTSYNDNDSEQDQVTGIPHEYCVSSFSEQFGESERVCDFGRRPPNGAINGRIASRAGAAVFGAQVCVDPSPGRAILFDGVLGHLSAPAAILPADAITVEMWVNYANLAGADPTFLSYAIQTGDLGLVVGDFSNKIRVKINGHVWNSTFRIDDGLWHHVAVTWASSTGTATLHVDDETPQTRQLSTGSPLPESGLLVLGQLIDEQSQLVPDRELRGRIDEFRVWNVVRTADEIAASRDRPLRGDESGLALCFPLDEGDGRMTADIAGGDLYGELVDGAYWTDEIAPVEVCATTDQEGNYSFANLRYRAGTSMKLTPRLDPRQFEPAFKTLALSEQSPVQNEVGFTDISSFAISGLISFQGYPSCPVEAAEIHVDGVFLGASDAQGRFSVSVPPGPHTVEAVLGDQVFEPLGYDIVVETDVAGYDFVNTTSRRLSGRVAGGCDREIGSLTFKIVAENQCLETTIAGVDRDYSVDLPPQKYFVVVEEVDDVPETLDAADVQKFFDGLGAQDVDLGTADQTLNFTYRAPISIEIAGFPEVSCEEITDPETGLTLIPAPIIPQGEHVPLTISVFEDYGNGDRCPVDSGRVVVYDEVLDEADTPVVLEIENGQAQYETIGNTPNIFVGRRDAQGRDRSFEKPITFVAEVKDKQPVQKTEWAIVTGLRPRVGTFVSATSEDFPLLILHDPPGDASFASLQKDETFSTTFTNTGLESLSGNFQWKTKTGVKIYKGVGLITLTDANSGFIKGIELGLESTQTGELAITTTISEAFSTSGSDAFIGDGADIYLGTAFNFLFAKTDVLEIEDCELAKSQTISVGADAEEPLEMDQTYLYTEDQIRDTIIPQLDELAAAQENPENGFSRAAERWRRHLTLNAENKEDALAAPEDRRSFSAGADYTYTHAADTTRTDSWSVRVFTNDTFAVDIGFEEAGAGVGYQFAINFTAEYTREESTSEGRTTTTSYTLSDDDPGDYFAVDIGTDPQYGTPVFGLVSGRSSCPWEPGPDPANPLTQPRDRVDLVVGASPDGPGPYAPDEAVVIPLFITNQSDSEEEREYQLWPVQTSNAGGAILALNGAPFQGGESFTIQPDHTQQATLTVARGPSQYFYDGLQVEVVSPCDDQISDVATFNVHFDAPCSDITLFRPQQGWAFNAQDAEEDGNTIDAILDDFVFDIEDKHLESIGAQYRVTGTDLTPYPIGTILRSDIPTFPDGSPKSAVLEWNVANVPDGTYETRAFASCNQGTAYSPWASGRIDRVAPHAFGDPQPADHILNLGEEISITFDEQIDCRTVVPGNVTLVVDHPTDPDTPIAVRLSCDGRKVIVTPVTPGYPELEGATLVATVQGIKDLAGNPMEARDGHGEAESWSLVVRRSEFAWQETSILKDAPFGSPGSFSATLGNGRDEDVTFTLEDVPWWLTPSMTEGILRSTESAEITFGIAEEVEQDSSYTATVLARVPADGSVAPLAIRVDVKCVPPFWTVSPSRFQETMSATINLRINGVASVDTSDMVAAFVGNQLRGVARPVFVPVLNGYRAFLTIGSNRLAGERVRFRVWDDDACRLYSATDATLSFNANNRFDLAVNALDEPGGTVLAIPVEAGWNWFSLNLGRNDMSLDVVLGDLNLVSGDLVKSSRSVFSQFDEDAGWVGSLLSLDNSSMYAMKVSQAGTILHEGVPKNDPIPVANGWNWIAYLPQGRLAVSTALGNLTPQQGDMVKSQSAYAQVVRDQHGQLQWIGSLTEMEPGRGYKLYLGDASASDGVLVYPAADAARSLAISGSAAHAEDEERRKLLTAMDPVPPFNPADYQYNMTITGTLVAEGEAPEGVPIIVAAFVGEQLRGIGEIQHVPSLGEDLVFLMVHSNEVEGEQVSFRAYDAGADGAHAIAETVLFRADQVLGRVQSPFVFHAAGWSPGSLPASFSLSEVTPNPLRQGVGGAITYELPATARVRLKIYDLAGREIVALVDEERPAGRHRVAIDPGALPSGLYFYRIEAGAFSQPRRLVVVK